MKEKAAYLRGLIEGLGIDESSYSFFLKNIIT